MECLPFVRRLSLIRTGSIPESPADFNRKAFPRRSKRRGTCSDGSTTSTLSLESDTDTAQSSDISSTERSCSRLNQLSAHSTRLSPSYEDEYESHDASGGGQRRGYDVRRGVIPACVLYNQIAESVDQSTMAYSMNSEMDIDIQLTNAEDFLGISIVGQNYSDGDSSLFVGTIIPGGAVSRDGRIEAGDLILAVNGHSLEGKSNKQAVEILRQAAKSSRSVRLSIIPCDNMSVYSDKSCVRPIDPFLWLAHNSFVEQNEALQGRLATQQSTRYGAGSKSISSLASSSLSSSMPSTAAKMRSRNGQKALPLETPVDIVANRLKAYVLNKPGHQNGKSKSISASSITGAQLREWLYHNMRGFKDLEEVSVYASQLFLLGYITPLRQIFNAERLMRDVFRLDESYVVQTRPLSPAIRPLTPSITDGSGFVRL